MAPAATEVPKPSGNFNPPPPQFQGFVSSDPNSEFPAEPDRYILYIHYGCPWAHRTNVVYHLKRLQKVVGFSAVSIHRDGDNGWGFDGTSGSDPVDPYFGFKNMREIYEKSKADYQGSYSIPVLFDRKKETIVNNDSSAIIRMLISSFDEFVEPQYRESNKQGGGLLPDLLKDDIDHLNAWVQADVSWGTYKCGLAKTQEDYDTAMEQLYKKLDQLEKILEGKRYLFGEHITEADIRLFTTIVRFDMAYATVFNCNWKIIRYDYPNLHDWVRRLYWEVDEEAKGAFKGTTHFDIFMEGYAHAAARQKLVPWGPRVHIMPLDDKATA